MSFRFLRWYGLRLLTACGVAGLLAACQHDLSAPSAPQDPTTFSSIQANILTPRCVNAGCHPGGNAPMSLAAGAAYNNLVNVNSATYGKPRVSPGNPNNSVLYLKLIGDNSIGGSAGRMPPGQPALSVSAIQAVRDWIAKGAPND
ncbi:MAG: hypothetical protein ONB48_18435 [candidate division KSB1 bacterium]|nr:hypothetical protein [candidate division KSB1 bacterium]MDZ7275873.1 hypothetical protein [candidate division KSB1 bacterium]MDZ7287623.1 hypothetical protein [candidate division KSB1 bacterium]MDZ7306785.1 hypothetical protein [candidate division KSB1 bacterium]MDZ7350601.1 hypothetical protein [candidate division KSB1 bacterium]